MKKFMSLFNRLLPYADRRERLVQGVRPSRMDLYRYYAKGPERYWLSCLGPDFRPTDSSGRFRLDAVFELLGSQEYSTFLDVGCGSGLFLVNLLRRWPRAVALGLDLSDAHLRTAREMTTAAGVADRCTLVKGDAEDLPLRGTFDAILCTEVLEHLLEPEKLLSRLRPLCRPDTQLVVSVPQIYMGGKAGTFELCLDGERHWYFHDQFDLDKVSSILSRSGFSVRQCLGVYFTFPRAYPFVSHILRRATGCSSRFDRRLNRLTENARAVNLVLRCGSSQPSSPSP